MSEGKNSNQSINPLHAQNLDTEMSMKIELEANTENQQTIPSDANYMK